MSPFPFRVQRKVSSRPWPETKSPRLLFLRSVPTWHEDKRTVHGSGHDGRDRRPRQVQLADGLAGQLAPSVAINGLQRL